MAEESAAAARRREAAEKGRRKLDEFRARKAAGANAKQAFVRDAPYVAYNAPKVTALNGNTPPAPPPLPTTSEPATAGVVSTGVLPTTGDVDRSPPPCEDPGVAANLCADLRGSGSQAAGLDASLTRSAPPPPETTAPPHESLACEIAASDAAGPTACAVPDAAFTGRPAPQPDSISSPPRSAEMGQDGTADKAMPAVDVDVAPKEMAGRAAAPLRSAQTPDAGGRECQPEPARLSPPQAPATSKPWAPPPPLARSLPKSHTLPAFSAVVAPATTNVTTAPAGSNSKLDPPVPPPIPLVTARASSYAALSDAYLDNPAPPPPMPTAASTAVFSVSAAPPKHGPMPLTTPAGSKSESPSLVQPSPLQFASLPSSSFHDVPGGDGAYQLAPSLPPLEPLGSSGKLAGSLVTSSMGSLTTCSPASPGRTDVSQRAELPTDTPPLEHAEAASSSHSSSSAVSATRDAAREAKRGMSWLAKMIAPPAPPVAPHAAAKINAPPRLSVALPAPVPDVESVPSKVLGPHSLSPTPAAPKHTTAAPAQPKSSPEFIALSSESVTQSAASYGAALVEDGQPDDGRRRASPSGPSALSHHSYTRMSPDPATTNTASSASRATEKHSVASPSSGSYPAQLPSASTLLAHPRANAKPLLFPTNAAKPRTAAQPPQGETAGGASSKSNGSASPPLQAMCKGSASDDCAHVVNPLAPSQPATNSSAQPTTKSDAAMPPSVQGPSRMEEGGEAQTSARDDAIAQEPQSGAAVQANKHTNGHDTGVDGSHSAGKNDLRNTQRERSQFAELQQYIDDLTRDKYELERALQQHSRLMETMHEENNALAEQFNAQGRQVAALQEKVGQYESEIAAQGVVLGSLSVQREEAQRGNTDAHERARALAQEVVDLEEKNLALASRELKARHELKSAREELEQRRRVLKTVEADRLDLRAALAALQEEQRMLTSRLRLATLNSELPVESQRGMTETSLANAATPLPANCTSESGLEPHADGASLEPAAANQDAAAPDDWLGGGPRIPEMVQVDSRVAPAEERTANMEGDPRPAALQGTVSDSLPMDIPQVKGISEVLGRDGAFMHLADLLDGPATIGTDHMAMIENIHSLLSEFAKHQQETLAALQMTQAEAEALRKQNVHLSKSLNSQTQRLELVIQQSMVEGKGQQLASRTTSLATDMPQDGALDVDAEGQVMVDNMIGWMLKFFGGRRRKSAPLK